MGTVVAEYHGHCTACEAHIVPGQRIERGDDGWEHVLCGEMAERKTACACERCFTVHAGECL